MHNHEQNQRMNAARAFAESLDQLQHILAQEAPTVESESSPKKEQSSKSWTVLDAWEDAAADLDQFFGDTQSLEDE